MNIAIIYPSLRAVGGAENVVVWLAESLVEKGHKVVLFTAEFSETAWGKIQERPYKVHLLNFKKSRSTLKTNREAGAMLRKALSDYEFDVINPHNYPASLWVYYAKEKRSNFPKGILFLHNLTVNFYKKILEQNVRKLPGVRNLWNQYRPKMFFRSLRQAVLGYRRLDQEAVRDVDKVLANSSYTAELARKIYKRDVEICSLGVPTKRFLYSFPRVESDKKKLKTDTMTLLTVTRIELQKNIGTLLNALKIVQNNRKLPDGVKYLIAGNGPYLSFYQKKCRRMGLGKVVNFIGHIPHAEICNLYAESSFIVHIPLDEPFGLVPLEAALQKKPSIVSDHGGPSVIVVDGVTGLHVNPLDPKDVAEKIAYLLTHPHEAKTMGEAGYNRIMKSMTWEIFLDKFESHLIQTAERKFQ